MSERFPNQDESFEPISYQLKTEAGTKTLRSPFEVAVVGTVGPLKDHVFLGVGEVVGASKDVPPNYMDLGLPLVRIKDQTAPRGFVELVGETECDIVVDEGDIEEMKDLVNENPELVMSASLYRRMLRAGSS